MTEILLFSTSAFAVLGWGFTIGLKHAVEADHLAAVSTIVTERKSLFGSAIVGGIWGLGHTISLMMVGAIVIFLNLQVEENSTTEKLLEFCVGIMLVLLGLNVLRKLFQGGTIHTHAHKHGSHEHIHPHLHEAGETNEPNTHHGFSLSPRALVIGMIHGLAGSAGLMLAVLPTIESRPLAFIYIAVFGIGSIVGMMLMSLLVGLPFTLTALKLKNLNLILQSIAGLASIVLGFYIIYEKGFVKGLLI